MVNEKRSTRKGEVQGLPKDGSRKTANPRSIHQTKPGSTAANIDTQSFKDIAKIDPAPPKVNGYKKIAVPGHNFVAFGASNSELVFTLPGYIGENLRQFLLTTLDHRNRYAIYRRLMKIDGEAKVGVRYVASYLQRCYLGPKLDIEDENYKPNINFLAGINQILGEMSFVDMLYDIFWTIIVDGNCYIRLYRAPDSTNRNKGATMIWKSEILAPDGLSIISNDIAKEGNWKESEVITDEDYYVVNESAKRKGKRSIPFAIPGTKAAEDETATPTQLPEFIQDEVVLGKDEVLHLSLERVGNEHIDRLGRRTYGIYGSSVMDIIYNHTKRKILLIQDFLDWLDQGRPRTDVSVDQTDLSNMDYAEGTTGAREEFIKTEMAREFDRIAESFYVRDNNPQSGTFSFKMPRSPGDVYIHDIGVKLAQIGGTPLPTKIQEDVKDENRAIAATLGVPMQLLGYEEGQPFSTARISQSISSGLAGGLLRSIDGQIKRFLKAEFSRRGWNAFATPIDWDHLYLDLLVDDPDTKLAEAEVENSKANGYYVMAQTCAILFGNAIITKNQAIEIMKNGPNAILSLPPAPDGDSYGPNAAGGSGNPIADILGGNLVPPTAYSTEPGGATQPKTGKPAGFPSTSLLKPKGAGVTQALHTNYKGQGAEGSKLNEMDTEGAALQVGIASEYRKFVQNLVSAAIKGKSKQKIRYSS